MTFWEFPFGVEVEAPDSAIQELEELATLAAGPNWDMEFAGTAIHFRFQHKQSGGSSRLAVLAGISSSFQERDATLVANPQTRPAALR
jgi:hypothetical protein